MTVDYEDTEIYFEAVVRAKKQGFNPDGEGEECLKYINARTKNMEDIKRERADAKRKAELMKLKPTDEHRKEELAIAAGANLDDSKPPEAITGVSPTYIPTREELTNMIIVVDHKIDPLNHALDDMQKEMKVLSDRIKSLEESKKEDNIDSNEQSS